MAAFGADVGKIVTAPEAPTFLSWCVALRIMVIDVEQDVGFLEICIGQRVARRGEPARTLPAIDGAENGSCCLKPIIARSAT